VIARMRVTLSRGGEGLGEGGAMKSDRASDMPPSPDAKMRVGTSPASGGEVILTRTLTQSNKTSTRIIDALASDRTRKAAADSPVIVTAATALPRTKTRRVHAAVWRILDAACEVTASPMARCALASNSADAPTTASP